MSSTTKKEKSGSTSTLKKKTSSSTGTKKTKTKVSTSSSKPKTSESANTVGTAASAEPNAPTNPPPADTKKDPLSLSDLSMLPFEAGQIFSKYDFDGDGKLSKQEFTELVRQNIDILRPSSSSLAARTGSLPFEVVSNRLLTHFDETAGVAISRTEVEQHQRMGNVVSLLPDAYKSRYDHLRALLTGKLFPRREHLLQLRRSLQHTAAEVDAKRRTIERETLSDTEQILERLRTVESMRQSAIRHQVIQIEDELVSIERLVRRVERANIDESTVHAPTTGVLLTSAQPGSAPVETISAPRATSMVEVIQEYGDLSAIIERMATKPITVQVDFPTDDFPKETAERLEVIARCDKYQHAISVKDQMLFQALTDREQFQKSLQDEKKLTEEYAEEVANWAELAQGLTHQLAAAKQENESLHQQVQALSALLRSHNIYYSPDD